MILLCLSFSPLLAPLPVPLPVLPVASVPTVPGLPTPRTLQQGTASLAWLVASPTDSDILLFCFDS